MEQSHRKKIIKIGGTLHARGAVLSAGVVVRPPEDLPPPSNSVMESLWKLMFGDLLSVLWNAVSVFRIPQPSGARTLSELNIHE